MGLLKVGQIKPMNFLQHHILLHRFEISVGVTGQALFSLYCTCSLLGTSCHGANYHCYANDMQLYISFKPSKVDPLAKLHACLKHVKAWINQNFLMLNSHNTEMLAVALKDKFLQFSLNINGFSVSSKAVVKNFVVAFDSALSFQAYINITRVAFFHLNNVSKLLKMVACLCIIGLITVKFYC
uniref:Uncharacterized protein n=1 Tax=Anguilla anguilla TaxID=7936 RepID=A0A0E9WTR6_ANGAN